MTKKIIFLALVMSFADLPAQRFDDGLIREFRKAAKEDLLDKWYPLAADNDDGGFYSEITYDFKIGDHQDKMIVTQSRHIWTNARAFLLYGEDKYLGYAEHGFRFLRDKMWDKGNGGFHNLVTKTGKPIPKPGEAKTAYGNAFAIYALAAYYKASRNEEALELAKKTFRWLEKHSHDPEYKGYFQHMEANGDRIARTADTPSAADTGYKDQNSTIHLLEAFTELYTVWPDELLRQRLEELLLLVRDTIVNDDNYMNLFFERDWTPVSFRDRSKETIEKHYYLDHVSFGHDVETAYLMLEASDALGRKDREKTLHTGKNMVDHALDNGWDSKSGGFYDGGYYFKGTNGITIVNPDKNWWSQAEGLNTLLIMDRHFPGDKRSYGEYFLKLWKYTGTYITDSRKGGWYEWGQDTRPETRKDPKGHIWKSTYHNFRALANCIRMLEE
ncbi:AGE family epimerase/isomerase [Sinomicrobium kalidii]|uniref:AGE family epimerase/isomerase n=1 Tax=Sinomicrobium kalidii TaxID=2900738 RepID=UPI001E3CBE59|nr:AGE family epimerase/isomerase [Sinomicrobium kalidii]UGU17888.1 AGE family epimerase/isomerase [Sinomicrobium kalidii]